MDDFQNIKTGFSKEKGFVIKVKGHLGIEWEDFLGEVSISENRNGETVINASDQSSMHGILNKIRDLGIELVSVKRI